MERGATAAAEEVKGSLLALVQCYISFSISSAAALENKHNTLCVFIYYMRSPLIRWSELGQGWCSLHGNWSERDSISLPAGLLKGPLLAENRTLSAQGCIRDVAANVQ